MKKLFLVASFCLFISSTVFASSLPNSGSGQAIVPIGYGVKISVDKLLTLTPKEYRHLTGHRLGLFKSLALKTIQKKAKKGNAAGQKSQVTALLLCIFLGPLGIHRFYLGYTWQGVVQLLTGGGLGIWWIIDLVRIITGDLKPKDGEYGKTL